MFCHPGYLSKSVVSRIKGRFSLPGHKARPENKAQVSESLSGLQLGLQ
jgi:hypothetical protein